MKISKPASRICALLLAVFMLFGMLPVSAFAVGENTVTYNRVTEIESGKEYVIVDKEAKFALSANGGTPGAVQVTLSTDGSTVTIDKDDKDSVSWLISETEEKVTIKGKTYTSSGDYDITRGEYYLHRESPGSGSTHAAVSMKKLDDVKPPKTEPGNTYHQWDYNKVDEHENLKGIDNLTNKGGNNSSSVEYFSLYYNESDGKFHSYKDGMQNRIYLYAVVENTQPEAPAISKAPTAKDLVYTGAALELVTAGEVTNGGTMLYCLEQNGTYSENIPVGTNAGAYKVWYKIDGVAAASVDVTIAAKTVNPTVTVAPDSVAYDGTAKQPTTVTVKDGETVIPASEYTVASTNNINAGTATVTVTDKENGNYAFTTATGTFTITAKAVTPTVTLSQESYSYDGTEKQPTVTVKDGETTIPAAEYEVTYADNINAGTAKVTVTDKAAGNYTFDPVEKSFTITAHSHNWTYTASGATITATCSGAGTCVNAEKTQTITIVAPTDLVYSGTAKVATITGAIDGVTNPTITYTPAECKNAGNYTASITLGEGAAAATATVSFTITAKTVTPTVTVDPTSFTYDGTAKQPTTVTVKDGETVIPASEYTVASTNNINVGTATVTVTDKTGGNYAFTTATGSFTITAKTVTPTVTVDPTSFTYDGTAKQPTTVTVKDGETVIPASEYTVASTNNTNAGTATVTVTDKTGGNYAFTTATGSFTITAKTVTPTVTVAPASVAYDGTAKQPTTVTVKDGETVIPASEYTVASTNNTNAGTATVTVTDKTGGNYAFTTATGNFTITAKSVTPTVTLSQNSYVYDGTAKQPTVTVKDGETTIPAAEYTVTYSNNTDAGTATVTVTDNANGNYAFTSAVTANFTITTPAAGQTVTYKQLTADEIAAIGLDDEVVFVAQDGQTYYALTNNTANLKRTAVTVSNGALTGTIPESVVWKVGTASQTQASKGCGFKLTNGTTVLGRIGDGDNGVALTAPANADNYNHGMAFSASGRLYNNNRDSTNYFLKYGNHEKSGGTTFYYSTGDNGSVLIFKKVVTGSVTPPATHTHNWSYAASGATITATCNGAGTCNATNKSITIVAPTDLTYNGSAKVATITGAIDGVTNPTITYTPAGNPVNAGNYTASITLGSATASVSFTIAKATPVVTAPTAKTGLTANGTAQALVNGGSTTGGTLVYSLSQNGTYTTTVPTGTDAGSYTVWYKVEGNDNYNAVAAQSVTVIIAQAAQPPVDDDDEFTKVDTIVNGDYIIVINEQYGLTNTTGTRSGSSNYYEGLKSNAVTITNGKVTAGVTPNMVWNVTVANGKLTIKDVSSKYLTANYGASGTGNTRYLQLGNTADANWEYSTKNNKTVLNNTAQNTEQTGNNNGCYLYLTDTTDHTVSVRSQGENYSYPATISFYKAGVVEGGGNEGGGNVEVTGVTLTPETLALTVGGTGTLTATVAPAGATNKAVNWTSSNTSVATVNNGVVTAVASGNATITVTTADGSFTDTCVVTVSAAAQPPVDEDDEPTYTKINASDIRVGDKIVIVGKNGNNYYALTNGSTQTTAVTVSNNELTITGSPNALVWTVGEATGNQVDTANGNDLDYVFSNGSTYFGRVTETNVVEFATGTAANTKYFGHDVQDGTIGNFSRSTNPPYYGLLFQNNQFIYVNGADNTSNASVLFFRAYNVAGGEGGGNQGGGNEGGGNVTNPTGTTFLAFSSDAHTKTKNANEGSPARLNNWLNNVTSKIGGTFDIMAMCGDFTYDGGSGITGTDYWDHAATVMKVVEDSNKVDGHVYINGNHEWQHGSYDSYKNSHDAAKKISGIGQVITGDDYIIYTFGAASSNQSYNTSDITALGNWLKTAPTNKPIFIISHFPIHSAANRTTGNADTLRTTLNEYADDHDIYFIWGHNHTNANSGENHYDKVYTGTLDNQTIKFTYLAAGCMSDSENNAGSAAVKGKGMVAKIVDGKLETLTYYAENGNVVGTPYEAPEDSTDPDQPGTGDPETPDEPNIPEDPGKVDTIEDGDYVIVVNNQYALTNVTGTETPSSDSSNGYIGLKSDSVTISNNKITSDVAANMIWTVTVQNGKLTIKDDSGKYLTADYGGSGYGNTRKLLVGTTADGNWEYANSRLNNTAQNTSQTNENSGCYLYLTNTADHTVSVRSQGTDFVNPANITFYKVEIVDEPEQPEQPEHKHTWGEATYTFAADGKSCTATRACTEDATHTESATATITSAVKTAATCETMGTTTYTATFTEEWAETQTKDVQDIPVIAHDFENGECTNCGAEDPAEADLFELYGANMLLGNNLAMNFYIEPADLEFGEDYYAVITKTYADREDLEIIIEDDDWDEAYNMYRVSLDKIAAKEMADEITVVIYNDEDEQVSKTWVDSVRDYTMRVLVKEEAEETSDKELLALYVEMLNYGAAAQDHFNYNEDDLANNELTAAQQAYGLGAVEMEDFRVEGAGYIGTSLTLESNILMNFFFNNIPAEHDDMYAIATYTDHYGEAKQVKVEGENFVKHNSTIWKVSVSGLVVADCRELVSVKVYEADGDVIASVTDSIESYTARMDGDGPLYVAIMNFAVAAYNTFH